MAGCELKDVVQYIFFEVCKTDEERLELFHDIEICPHCGSDRRGLVRACQCENDE